MIKYINWLWKRIEKLELERKKLREENSLLKLKIKFPQIKKS